MKKCAFPLVLLISALALVTSCEKPRPESGPKPETRLKEDLPPEERYYNCLSLNTMKTDKSKKEFEQELKGLNIWDKVNVASASSDIKIATNIKRNTQLKGTDLTECQISQHMSNCFAIAINDPASVKDMKCGERNLTDDAKTSKEATSDRSANITVNDNSGSIQIDQSNTTNYFQNKEADLDAIDIITSGHTSKCLCDHDAQACQRALEGYNQICSRLKKGEVMGGGRVDFERKCKDAFHGHLIDALDGVKNGRKIYDELKCVDMIPTPCTKGCNIGQIASDHCSDKQNESICRSNIFTCADIQIQAIALESKVISDFSSIPGVTSSCLGYPKMN